VHSLAELKWACIQEAAQRGSLPELDFLLVLKASVAHASRHALTLTSGELALRTVALVRQDPTAMAAAAQALASWESRLAGMLPAPLLRTVLGMTGTVATQLLTADYAGAAQAVGGVLPQLATATQREAEGVHAEAYAHLQALLEACHGMLAALAAHPDILLSEFVCGGAMARGVPAFLRLVGAWEPLRELCPALMVICEGLPLSLDELLGELCPSLRLALWSTGDVGRAALLYVHWPLHKGSPNLPPAEVPGAD
jgi:hypothetical protein